MELLRRLELLAHSERTAKALGQDWEASWDWFEDVYGARPAIIAELAILENCRVADLVRFFLENTGNRQAVIYRVIERGGLYDHGGKWVDVTESRVKPQESRVSFAAAESERPTAGLGVERVE